MVSSDESSKCANKWEDDEGESVYVETQALANLFELHKGNVECVLLNACYSEEQAQAIAKHIPVVIGMADSVAAGRRGPPRAADGPPRARGAARGAAERAERGPPRTDGLSRQRQLQPRPHRGAVPRP